jgi:hypothetical protein
VAQAARPGWRVAAVGIAGMEGDISSQEKGLSHQCFVPTPHTAEVIGEELYESLVEWNLDEKISSVTLDNCTTNDVVIPSLVRNIEKYKLLNDRKLLHMRCFVHIINLIVKDGL